jgi:hypothetical protein
MRLAFVSVTIACSVVACTDGSNPVASMSRGISKQTVGDTIPPLAPGARVDTLPLPYPKYLVSGLNNLGQISGTFTPDTGATKAFRGTPGNFQFLNDNAAGALNDEGDALVNSGAGSGIWERSGQVVPLALLFPDSTLECSAQGINNQRQSAGLCIIANNGISSYVVEWSATGKAQALSAEGMVLNNGEAFSINQLGQVAGFDFALTPTQAFVIGPNNKARILPPLPGGGQGASARRANEGQWVVGQAGVRAVAWTPNDSAIDMGVDGQAFWINDANIAVGPTTQGSLADDFGLVWTPTIGLRRLPPVQSTAGNIEIDQPIIINEQNQILGTAQIQNSSGTVIATYNVIWTLPPGYGGTTASTQRVSTSHVSNSASALLSATARWWPTDRGSSSRTRDASSRSGPDPRFLAPRIVARTVHAASGSRS